MTVPRTAAPETAQLVAEIRALAREVRAKVGRLERLAAGSQDVTAAAAEARAATPADELADRAVKELEAGPRSTAELAAALDSSPGAVSRALRRLKAAGVVGPVPGDENPPRWRRRVGDGCSSEVLFREVERLCRERPMSEADLLEATGARRNRVRGAITHFRRFGPEVINVSPDANRALWYVPKARPGRV